MNTITQIENALKGVNQAVFQSLINHLLHLQGNKFIGAPGSVVGKEKTSKGSPDSFFIQGNGYIFVEATTQEKLGTSKSFFDKLSKDVDHCFNEKSTTIPKEEIEKVILACNEKINAEEYKLLNAKVKSYNPNTGLEVFNIQNLPLLLFDIPKLAEEYLNVQIVKGDIYTLQQFLSKTTKGLQPSLTNEFMGRESELQNCLEILKRVNVLLLSGGAGVGKSKFAVKILEELSKENYIPIVIQSSAVSLWDDYKHLFNPGHQYIILFDDANKSIANLNYLLDKLDTAESYSAKIIITSRDYVKRQISATLNNRPYQEISIPEFKDKEIEKIIVSALPNLQYYIDIRRKIVDLAKGNARVALMATYSVTPDAETNYLNSPVLLYEKYFHRISEEIGIFNNPIILKSLAIVSFFGVLDRKNEQIKSILSTNFGIDWNDLWTAVMELHNNEILDVYANEIVKVSDQVLGSFSFYKCFIDNKSAVINYSQWIAAFTKNFSHRVRITLVDSNNTFDYYHVKEQVLPHLDEVLNQIDTDEALYSFYDLFWFYKGRDCLLYLKRWIEQLPQEHQQEFIIFSYVHNDHTTATKYFDLLRGFWSHSNELLKPSLELTFKLLDKQPNRLPETLKFIHEDFKYNLNDRDHGYLRQNILLDVLLEIKTSGFQQSLANGIFLNVAEELLGWHYTEYGTSKGHSFTIYNFDLYKSDSLLKLRERILERFYEVFELTDQVQKVLHKIIYPGGDLDNSIYVQELPIYQKLISRKLTINQYSHCKFVSVLAKRLIEADAIFPNDWDRFINSEIRKLSMFLKPGWEYREDKSIEEFEKEKRKEFDDFILSNDWSNIEKFLLNISDLFQQQKDTKAWRIEPAINDIYISIAKKDKNELVNALKLFFSGAVLFPLRANVIIFVMIEGIMTGKELLHIMDGYDFKEKEYLEAALLERLPEDQIDRDFLKRLIIAFKKSENNFIVYRLLDYLKYEKTFTEYKGEIPDLAQHNIVTYLTSILLSHHVKSRRDFGYDFCEECAPYFINQLHILKEVYWTKLEADSHFDHDGKELKSIIDLDRTFINDNLKSGMIGLGYSSRIRMEKINVSILWGYPESEELIEDILLTILDKAEYISLVEEDIYSLFKFSDINEDRSKNIMEFISKISLKHVGNEKLLIVLAEVVYNCFRNWFIEYFREFLLLNKNIETLKKINFGRSESWSGSRVPTIQKKIDFYQEILKVIGTLPNILDYSEHIDYFEQHIKWKRKEIVKEQERDFMDEFH